jgi:hypothetical protein
MKRFHGSPGRTISGRIGQVERKAMRRFPALPWIAGLTIFLCGVAPAFAQPNPPPRLDRGKGEIELPLKLLVKDKTTPPAAAARNPNGVPVRRDMGKGRIELPIELLVKEKTAPPAVAENPKVEPGKVKWHATFAAACAASQKSRKPVLLFQMMGKLDDQFC